MATQIARTLSNQKIFSQSKGAGRRDWNDATVWNAHLIGVREFAQDQYVWQGVILKGSKFHVVEGIARSAVNPPDAYTLPGEWRVAYEFEKWELEGVAVANILQFGRNKTIPISA